jgi:membrane-bound lytic murein transglycosylase F
VNGNLDLLSQEKWYQDLRFGYARGFEAKQYVENIRSYYDILIWMDTREHPMLVAQGE